MRRVGSALIAAALLCCLVETWTDARASGEKDYAYLFLQGRIEDPSRGMPAVGATVRLRSGSEVFEVVTDSQGAFVFDNLPVTSFDLEITTSDGRVIRGAKQLERLDPDRARVEVEFSRDTTAPRHQGERQEVLINAGREQIAIGVPSPTTNWARFWKQGLVFVGVAVLLAL
jgi:hypothetical protein